MNVTVLNKSKSRYSRRSLREKVILKNFNPSIIIDRRRLDPGYFIQEMLRHLRQNSNEIQENTRVEVLVVLQDLMLDALQFYEMVAPLGIAPINYSPEVYSSSSSGSDSDSGPGEAECGVLCNVDLPPPATTSAPIADDVPPSVSAQDDRPSTSAQTEASSSDSSELDPFLAKIEATMIFLTDPQNRRLNPFDEDFWQRFRVGVLRSVASEFGIRRNVFGSWFYRPPSTTTTDTTTTPPPPPSSPSV